MSIAKLAVPVALGLSLATVTAFVVYYVFKKDEDDTKEQSVKTSRVNVIEIQVPKSIVPALIGRSGTNIKDIERKSGALIHCKKFTDKDYDVFIIRGRREATQLAETLIHEFVKNQPVIVEDMLLVPTWACGRIIGTGGENINDISHRSGARVKVEGGAEQGATRSVNFRGTRQQVDTARKLVEACVSQEKCRREIEVSKRSPRHSGVAGSPPPALPARVGEEPTEMPGDKHATKKSEASGSAIEVYVSAVSSPSRFWVQFVGAQVAQLDELVNTMTDYYGRSENRETHALSQVSVGQIVAAVFRHDGRWYRARVADIRPNEFDATKQVADVFFVDYGDSEYVATHELCELRADLLRLRFQAMECFLAGVRPSGSEEETEAVTQSGVRWERWQAPAVERFEELAQVARWKPLVSKTITYKKTPTADDEKEKEIPGIKLFDVTDEGEIDIGAVLIAEGWALPAVPSPRASPARVPPHTPFGDLGASRILGGLLERNDRSSSLPKDHERTDHTTNDHNGALTREESKKMPSSKSLGSGLETSASAQTQPKPADMSYPESSKPTQQPINGSHDAFLHAERQHADKDDGSTETLVPIKLREELKANMNRIDSHHGNLAALSRTHHDL